MKLSAELRRLVRLAAAMALGAALTGMGLHGEVQARPKNTHPLQEKKASSPAPDANAASDEKASRENDLKAVEEALAQLRAAGTQREMLDRMQTRKGLYELVRYAEYARLDERIAGYELRPDPGEAPFGHSPRLEGDAHPDGGTPAQEKSP